jgi:hypothetical protein
MDVIIGLDYDTCGEADEEIGKGHHTIRRIGVTLQEIIEELKDILINGSHYPQFPSSAHPELVYAYDLNKQEDADIYPLINNELIKSMEQKWIK